MTKKSLFHYANNPRILFTSAKISLLVGTILAFINHYDSILAQSITEAEKIQILVTYFVPFSVATYSAASHARRLNKLRQLKMKREIANSCPPSLTSVKEELTI